MAIELLPTLEINLEGHVEGVKSLVKLTCVFLKLHFRKGEGFFVWCGRAGSSWPPILLASFQLSIFTVNLVLGEVRAGF